MLTIVRSPMPALQFDGGDLPPAVRPFGAKLDSAPQGCVWVVPTGRQRRALARHWLPQKGTPAGFVPSLHTFESFVAETLGYGLRQRPAIGAAERLLRLARIWQDSGQRSAGPGALRQLDRFLRDWQACGLPCPANPSDPFETAVHRYLQGLETDRRLDRMGSLRTLAEELADPESGPCRFYLPRLEAVIFDGFARMEQLELEVVAALSHRCDVLILLVAVRGQLSWQTVTAATEELRRNGAAVRVHDFPGGPAGCFSSLGRQLFPSEPAHPPAASDGPPGLLLLKAPNATAEVETVARRIKQDYRSAHAGAEPLRLSEIAVVIPGPAYDPLIREVFPRHGLVFNLAGRSLSVADSRPAQVLMAALGLIHGQWRADLLLDFLGQPLVRRMLKNSHLLHDLFERRPRARRRLDLQAWQESWDRQLQAQGERVAQWQDGTLNLPERVVVSREEFVEQQRELAESQHDLIASLNVVLTAVAALERAIAQPPAQTPLHELVAAGLDLLARLGIEEWLTPPLPPAAPSDPTAETVPWVEYEKDQQAYFKLLSVLRSLLTIPENHLPRTADARPDVLTALLLALESESYQIKTEDDAGVQVFEAREIRGLHFRHVYALGLVDGKVPAVPEEGVLAERRRHDPLLRSQLRDKETEAAWLFSQLFEAAREMLVLCRPHRDSDRITLPSPFLTAVTDRVSLPDLRVDPMVTTLRDAEVEVGRIAGRSQDQVETPASRCPAAAQEPFLASLLQSATAHAERSARPHRIGVQAPSLLRYHFHDGYAFSPSELETYSECAFRYFGKRLLRLTEREADVTRMHYGLLIHRILHAFYSERRQAHPKEDEPLPPTSAADRARLAELFQREWAQLEEGPAFPELEQLFLCENGVLDFFFTAMRLVEDGEANYGNLFTEYEVPPLPLGHDGEGRPVHLTGKIDRVDVHRSERRRARVIDYKTGKKPGPTAVRTKSADGRLLQLQLYGVALQQLFPQIEPMSGVYLHLNEKSTGKPGEAICCLGDEIVGDQAAAAPFQLEEARRLALSLAAAIRAGEFSLTRFPDGADGECTAFCPLRHACRHPDGYRPLFS